MYEEAFETLKNEYMLKITELSQICTRIENGYAYFIKQDKQKADEMISDLKDFNKAISDIMIEMNGRIEKIERAQI